jgi:transposase
MEGILALNKKEQNRLRVLNELEKGKMVMRELAEFLGLSERQGWRLLAAYREEGAAGLAHGNRGRKPVHTLGEEVRKQVVELAQKKYGGFNHQHLTEMLGEQERLEVSRSSVRRILLVAGIRSPKKRRPPRHRRRRERYAQEGMLLQIDGSRHDWLEGRGPWLTLISSIDDATGKVPAAIFREQEDAQGYFLLLREIVEKKGVPLAVYHDRHGIFERSPLEREENLREQLLGQEPTTQVGRLLKELGIESIPARSPQAKGRIERLFGTFQDRLGSELRLAQVKTLEEANGVLKAFLARFNRRFAVSPAAPGLSYRPVSSGLEWDEIFCFKYDRTVGADNVVSFADQRIQIYPCNGRQSYYRARVEIQERMDGSLGVFYQGKCLATQSAPPEAPVLRVQKRGRLAIPKPSLQLPSPPKEQKELPPKKEPLRSKPGPDHPWRKPYKNQISWKKKPFTTDIFTEHLT